MKDDIRTTTQHFHLEDGPLEIQESRYDDYGVAMDASWTRDWELPRREFLYE